MCINKAFNISEALEFIQGKAWTTDMDWEKVDYWFFPLCYKEHFVVFCVNLKKRCGDYLDSLDREEVPAIYQRTSSYIMELANTLIPMFRSNPPPEPIDVDNWVNHRGVRQPDKTSCGIFALNMLEMWEGAVTPDILSWADPMAIERRRQEVCLLLLISPYNVIGDQVLEKAYEEARKIKEG
ncbi:hypothetical protein LINPERPRIM_LOCUS32479 [Linum perenne]